MSNNITDKFNNKIETLAELEQYLVERIDHIRNTRGKETNQERELQDILGMLKK